jgi:hypothetical protein|tara:strand:+ start:4260 stop:4646 length:387 start_codon:yes stop_codon:yes gene_type:complete
MEIKAGLLILGLIFGVSGCSFLSGTKDLNVRTIRVDRSIPIQPWPKPISMNGIHFYVVTEKNFEDFKERFLKKNSDLVYIAMSVRDYENLALDVQDVKRYIKQQKEIIIYYEIVAEGTKKEETKKEEE